MIEAACCKADITPPPGLPLSGFAFRENKSSTHVDDPIRVRVLVLRYNSQFYLLASYELLGIGSQLNDLVLNLLNKEFTNYFIKGHCILSAVHNHSAPGTMNLVGESRPDSHYLHFIAKQTITATRSAIKSLQPVQAFLAQKEIVGLTYNRRAVLADGRVTMAIEPDGEVVERGPVDNTLTLIQLKSQSGSAVAGIVHFPCHGIAVCTQGITHDVPGRIAQEMEQLIGAPCLYLQGGAGDLNPTVVSSTHQRLNEWSEAFHNQVEDLAKRLYPVPFESLISKEIHLPIRFRELPERDHVASYVNILRKVAGGDVLSDDVQAALRNIGMIINLPPGALPDPQKAAYFARTLIRCNENILKAIDSGGLNNQISLRLTFWRIGKIHLIFIGAELFALAGLFVRNLSPERFNLLVTYSGPVVGYIPDDDAMQKGGYEANYSWMFYGQPAPFAIGTLNQILETIKAEL